MQSFRLAPYETESARVYSSSDVPVALWRIRRRTECSATLKSVATPGPRRRNLAARHWASFDTTSIYRTIETDFANIEPQARARAAVGAGAD